MSSSAQLLAALQQTGLAKSIKQWSIPSDKLPDSSEAPPDVVFLDLSRDPEQFFSFAAHVRRVHPTVKLVAVSAVVPPGHQLLLEAMRSGVQDFLPKPVSSDTLKDMLSRFDQDLEAKDRPSLDKLIVVMGSKGGVGATTVSVNLGVQLSTFAKKRVVLLDLRDGGSDAGGDRGTQRVHRWIVDGDDGDSVNFCELHQIAHEFCLIGSLHQDIRRMGCRFSSK